MSWTHDKPKQQGMYLAINPYDSNAISKQMVILFCGELVTTYPNNEFAKIIKVADLPDIIKWMHIPWPDEILQHEPNAESMSYAIRSAISYLEATSKTEWEEGEHILYGILLNSLKA